MKQVGPTGGDVPPSVDASSTGEEGQHASEVGPIIVVVEVVASAPSSILVKRKRDDATGPSSHKKLKAPMSLYALRQAAGLGSIAGRLMIAQDVPLAPPVINVAAATAALSPPLTTIV